MSFAATHLIGFMAGGEAAPRTVAYVTQTDSGTDLTTYTFNTVDFGAEASDRLIVVVVDYRQDATRSVSSATIGGVAASIHTDTGSSLSNMIGAAIISASVPTGTTGTVAVTFSGALENAGIGVYRLTGLTSTTPYDADSVNSNSAGVSRTIDVPDGGILIAGMAESSNTATTWTGATEDYDAARTENGRRSYASASGLSAETGRTVSPTVNALQDAALAVVTFA